MSTIDIRPLCLSDCEKIGPLLREIWLDAYKGIQTDEELLERSHEVHTPDQIAQEIDDPNVCSVVATQGNRIIGHARSDLDGDTLEIVRLYLLREFYGKSIGKALLHEVEGYFGSNHEIWLDVWEENKRALDFYLAQGYQIMERATEVQSQGRDIYHCRMRKLKNIEGS